MHSRAKAEMRSGAIERISAAADTLGRREGVENFVALQQRAQRARDPEVQSIFELKAVADLLEKIVEQAKESQDIAGAAETLRSAPDEDLKTLDGVGDKSVKKLREALG